MNSFTLWLAMLGGPVVGLIYVEVSYALVSRACISQNKTPLLLSLIVALALTVAIALVAWRAWRLAIDATPGPEACAVDRSRFMALSGLGLAALSVLLVLASAIPIYILGACD